jgi:hypothetical protein
VPNFPGHGGRALLAAGPGAATSSHWTPVGRHRCQWGGRGLRLPAARPVHWQIPKSLMPGHRHRGGVPRSPLNPDSRLGNPDPRPNRETGPESRFQIFPIPGPAKSGFKSGEVPFFCNGQNRDCTLPAAGHGQCGSSSDSVPVDGKGGSSSSD